MAVTVRLHARDFSTLLSAARCGSSEAAGELLTAFQPMLVEYAHSWLCPELRRRYDPCDLAQHTLSQALQQLGAARATSPGQFAKWLQAMLRRRAARLACRYVRGRDGRPRPRELSFGRQEVQPPTDAAGSGTRKWRVLASALRSPEDEAIAREEERGVQDAVCSLAAPAALAVSFRIEQELSFSAIGAMLGITAEAARCRFRRAILQLRGRLKGTM